MHDTSGNPELRPAVPICLAPSENKRGGAFKHRTFAPNSFGRKAALSKEEGNGVNDVARDEENFRSGLKRNIAQLSNLSRVNKEELARLREQLKAKDDEIHDLKVRAKKADRKEEARERDLSLSEKAAAARSRLRKVVAYGNMAVMAGRLASGTRQRLEEAVAEPSKRNSLEQEMAVAAMGAKHTEQQLLRASRDLRGQLERALQEAEALRTDSITFKNRVSLVEKEKADLEARVAWLSDEVKLQTAPLMALRLELMQARSDTEMMRQRLKEERRESRLRVGGFEKASNEGKQRRERLEFDLNETTKALQRESLKASTFEEAFQQASAATKILHKEVEQRKADAKRIAQEFTRMQIESDRPVEHVQDEKTSLKQSEEKRHQQAIIATLEASIKKLHLQKVKSDDAVKELQTHRAEAEEREQVLKAAKKRADSYAEENRRLRLAIEKEEEEQRQRDQERHDREVEHENERRVQNLQSRSLRARLCRTLEELCEAEEAGELAITCPECAELFKNPRVMAPCGHTLCADCSPPGDDEEQEQPVEGRSGWLLGGGGEDSTSRAKPTCRLCVKQEGAGVAAQSACVGSAPSRVLATLVTKFTFRRQLLGSLKEIGALLWQQ